MHVHVFACRPFALACARFGALALAVLGCAPALSATSASAAGNGVIAVVPTWEECEYYGLDRQVPPARAADGELICSDRTRGIVVVAADGSGARRLPLPLDKAYRQVGFSGDGRYLSWNDDRGYYLSTWFGTRTRRIAGCGGGCWAAWSPVGAAIVFNQGNSLVRVDVNSGRRRKLAVGGRALWSRGATLIAYLRGKRVMRMRPDGSSARMLTRLPSGVRGATPDGWSEDGHCLLIEAYNENTERDRRYAVDLQTGRTRLAKAPRRGGVISPDGRLRAFGRTSGVYVSRRDGSARRQLLGAPASWNAKWYEVQAWQPLP